MNIFNAHVKPNALAKTGQTLVKNVHYRNHHITINHVTLTYHITI